MVRSGFHKNLRNANRALLLPLLVIAASGANGAVRLPKIFSSHAVLQRDEPIHIWGWSDPGESVSVSLNGANQTATGDEFGHWSIYLPPASRGRTVPISRERDEQDCAR